MTKRLDSVKFKEIDDILYKKCTSCHEYKPLIDRYFHKDKNYDDGFINRCKTCAKIKKKSRQYSCFYKEEKGVTYKQCTNCKKWLPIGIEYWTILSNGEIHSRCRICATLIRKEWEENNPLVVILGAAFRRIKKISLKYLEELDFDLDYLMSLYYKQNCICAISGLEMTIIVGNGKNYTNVSVDRIDSSKGYTKDNIQLIQSIVNIMKLNQFEEEFVNLCNVIADYNR